tara:strand:+ start:2277 stop:2645 length:369 start_codon:yes stop_codon:yes gene_type:complete
MNHTDTTSSQNSQDNLKYFASINGFGTIHIYEVYDHGCMILPYSHHIVESLLSGISVTPNSHYLKVISDIPDDIKYEQIIRIKATSQGEKSTTFKGFVGPTLQDAVLKLRMALLGETVPKGE